MSVYSINEEDILDLLKDTEFDPSLKEPKRCRQCDRLMSPRVDLGRLVFECPACDNDTTTPA